MTAQASPWDGKSFWGAAYVVSRYKTSTARPANAFFVSSVTAGEARMSPVCSAVAPLSWASRKSTAPGQWPASIAVIVVRPTVTDAPGSSVSMRSPRRPGNSRATSRFVMVLQ